LAYALPTFVFLLIPLVLYAGRNIYTLTPPRGSIILETARVVAVASKGKWTLNPVTLYKRFKRPDFWAQAKPSYYGNGESGNKVPSNIT
jgi:POT family proton-dependent oligopeptide transporter